MRQTQLGLTLVFLLVMSGIAWAGKEAYRVVMSQDKKLCEHMLALFNADMKKGRGLEYQKHEEFIVWDPVDTGELPIHRDCRKTLTQTFDINNDRTDELVIRTRHCYKDQLTDSLYVFPFNSNAVKLFKEHSPQVWDAAIGSIDFQTYELKKMPGVGDSALFPSISRSILESFKFGQTFYVSMTDLRQEFIVIAKYLRDEEIDDVCYFRGKPLI